MIAQISTPKRQLLDFTPGRTFFRVVEPQRKVALTWTPGQDLMEGMHGNKPFELRSRYVDAVFASNVYIPTSQYQPLAIDTRSTPFNFKIDGYYTNKFGRTKLPSGTYSPELPIRA